MQIPIQTSDLNFIEAIVPSYEQLCNENFETKLEKNSAANHIAMLLGYEDAESMQSAALEYIKPYQISIPTLTQLITTNLATLWSSENVTDELAMDIVKSGFLQFKSIQSLNWQFEERDVHDQKLYKVALADSGKNIIIETGTFINPEDVPNKDSLIMECSNATVTDFLNIKNTLGYHKERQTLSVGIDDMLADILASITFEASVLPLNEDNFDFKEQDKNTVLLSLPALVRVCGDELDLYAYVFDMNEEETAYYAVLLNEFYSADIELFFGDIVEITSNHFDLLPTPALYRDLLIYHNSVEPEYTPEDLRECFGQYCSQDDLKLFDLWYDKFMSYLNEIDQNFYATKIMNHVTNLVLNEKFLKHKVLHLIEYSEEHYKKYKRNEISLNRESYKIRKLINKFMQQFMASKGVEIDFVPFDENDYFSFIKKEKLPNNDQSKLLWLSSKYVGEDEFQKKLYDLGSFSLQSYMDES